MKNLFFILAIAIASTTFGQTYQTKTMGGGGGFDVTTGTATSEVLSVDGKDFTVFTTESGAKFIKAVSPRSGNEYAVWVYTATADTFEGRTIYTTKRGTPCVYKLTKAGFPYPSWLETAE